MGLPVTLPSWPSAPAESSFPGGPESVTDEAPPRAPDAVFELGVPVLGICYGMQTMAAQLGGRVAPSAHREFGYAKVRRTGSSRLLDGIADDGAADPGVLDVWMSHGDRVEALPPGFAAIAATAERAVRRDGERRRARSTACSSTRR